MSKIANSGYRATTEIVKSRDKDVLEFALGYGETLLLPCGWIVHCITNIDLSEAELVGGSREERTELKSAGSTNRETRLAT